MEILGSQLPDTCKPESKEQDTLFLEPKLCYPMIICRGEGLETPDQQSPSPTREFSRYLLLQQIIISNATNKDYCVYHRTGNSKAEGNKTNIYQAPTLSTWQAVFHSFI